MQTTEWTEERAQNIAYRIHGSEIQCLEIQLRPKASVTAEAGAMVFMEQGVQMNATVSTAENDDSMLGKLWDAGKRMLSGEGLFFARFTNQASTPKRVGLATPYPGSVVILPLARMGGSALCQQGSFLAGSGEVSVSIGLQKRLGAGFFGGTGFIMQSIQGNGTAFVHAGGSVVELELEAGHTLFVDTACLVAMQSSVSLDIEMVKGMRSLFFGGEGIFLAKLTGPGRVWAQTLPYSKYVENLAQQLKPYLITEKK